MGLNPKKINFQRGRLYLPATSFDLSIKAPTINITGNVAGTVAIGIDSDANGAALSKVAVTDRTGITGVQAPDILSAADASVIIGPVSGASGLVGAAFANFSDAVRLTMGIPSHWDRVRPLRTRFMWLTASTTTTEVGQLGLGIKVFGDAETLAVPTTFKNVNDSPSATANQVLISDWSTDIITPWNADMTDTDEFMSLEVKRGTSDTLTGTLYFLGVEIEYHYDFGSGVGRGGDPRTITVAG